MTDNAATRRTLDQKRAEHALNNIQAIRDDKNDGYYVSYVSSLPATIVMNGLGQALVTQLAKAKGSQGANSHYLLFHHVAGWLSQQIPEIRSPIKNDFKPVIERLMQADQQVYLRAQAEAMAYLNWLKQFARAYLAEKEGQRD